MLKLVDTKFHNEPKFIDLGSGAPEMTTVTDHFKPTYFILAEGPRRSDAGFTSQMAIVRN